MQAAAGTGAAGMRRRGQVGSGLVFEHMRSTTQRGRKEAETNDDTIARRNSPSVIIAIDPSCDVAAGCGSLVGSGHHGADASVASPEATSATATAATKTAVYKGASGALERWQTTRPETASKDGARAFGSGPSGIVACSFCRNKANGKLEEHLSVCCMREEKREDNKRVVRTYAAKTEETRCLEMHR